MRVTGRRVLIAATVAVIAAGVSVTAAIYRPTSGPVRIQQADVVASPSPTAAASPSPVDTSSPSPVTNPTAAPVLPSQPPAAPTAAPTTAPAPPPPPTYCGHAFVYDSTVVTLTAPVTVWADCTLSQAKVGEANGAVRVSGYIDTPQGRVYREGDPTTTPPAWFHASA